MYPLAYPISTTVREAICRPAWYDDPTSFPEERRSLQAAIEASLPIALAHGFPEELWSHVRKEDVATPLLSTGYLPAYLRLHDLPHHPEPMSKEEQKGFPELALERSRSTAYTASAFWCFTQGEEWWTGPHSFLCNTPVTVATSLFYQLSLSRLELRTWKPKPGPGRPSSGEAKKETNPELYERWLAVCKVTKDRIEGMEQANDQPLWDAKQSHRESLQRHAEETARYGIVRRAHEEAKRGIECERAESRITWEQFKASMT